MRVRVQNITDLLRDGLTADQIVKQLPYVEHEDVWACLEYGAKGGRQ